MLYIRQICASLGFALLLIASQPHAASLEEQEVFAGKILALINANKLEYAKAATEKYLEIEPDAAPVNRVLAQYYMKTSADAYDDLVKWRYPDDVGKNIIELLNKSVALNPDDEQAWSLLVYTHALQNNVEQGKEALAKAEALEKKAQWLDYNAALLAVRDNNLRQAVDRVAPMAIAKQVPSGPDTKNIIRNSWILLTDIALQDPSLDPLDTIRDGLVTRIDIKNIADFINDYDKNAAPLLLIFSSQDAGCGYCRTDLSTLHQAARYNKDNGSPLNMVYISIEPWTDARYHARILRNMNITGAPAYHVIHDGYHIRSLPNNKTRLNSLRRFVDDPERMIAAGDRFVKVLPRVDYLHDQMHEEFVKYKKQKSDGFRAMAYVLEHPTWRMQNVRDKATQDEADELAISSCTETAIAANIETPCQIYARGKKLVDPDALNRTRERNSQAREMKKWRVDKKKKQEKGSKLAKKQQPDTAKETAQGDAKAAGEAIAQYAANEDHYKALAIAQDAEASVSGTATNHITQSRAVEAAMDNCETARAENGIEAECILHSIGKKEVTDQSAEHIATLIAKQQKRNAKNSALAASYKKYRKFSTDKAYAYSVNENGDWTYGMAFGKRGTDEAKAAALEQCEQQRTEKAINAECQILILNSKFVEQP